MSHAGDGGGSRGTGSGGDPSEDGLLVKSIRKKIKNKSAQWGGDSSEDGLLKLERIQRASISNRAA